MSMEANAVDCLGCPAEIADAAVREFRRRRQFLSRSGLAAFFTFVLLPLPLCLCVWVVVMFSATKVIEWLGLVPATELTAADMTWVPFVAARCTMLAALVVTAGTMAAIFSRVARRTGRPLVWGVIAIALITFATANVGFNVQLDRAPGHRYWFGPAPVYLGVSQWLQCVIPLLVGILMLRRTANVAVESAP